MKKKIKIITILGARPQFIKAAAVSRAIRKHNDRSSQQIFHEILIHTGQHYDDEMSGWFFDQLDIPTPRFNLKVGSGNHGRMTADMIAGLEPLLIGQRPDVVMLYGDTNTTLAGAIATAKLNIPIAHVEAGLRSYNRSMPEEINRLLTDHVSRHLFAPTPTAVENLAREGITNGVVQCGDVMLEAYEHYRAKAVKTSTILQQLGVLTGTYSLATVHRQENTDDRRRITGICDAIKKLSRIGHTIILPLHPRTRSALNRYGIQMESISNLHVIQPVNYLDMIQLEANSKIILTDSGGVQKEAYFSAIPCITLREETEWVETVDAGVNTLAGADMRSIVDAFMRAQSSNTVLTAGLYGNGDAAQRILDTLQQEYWQ